MELEKNNEMALSEMDEIKDLLRIQEEKVRRGPVTSERRDVWLISGIAGEEE